MPRLVINGRNEPRRDVLLAGDVTIGRGPANVVVLGDDAVSTAHARIRVEKRETWLEDLGSTNGTLVGGRRVPARQRVTLSPGDRVAIGPYVMSYAAETPLATVDDGAPPPHNTRSSSARSVRLLRIVALVSVLAALAAVVLKRIL